MGLVLVRRVAPPQLAEQLFALGIPVRDDDLAKACFVLADRVHDAVVGDPRDEQVPEVGERRLVVERAERSVLASARKRSRASALRSSVMSWKTLITRCTSPASSRSGVERRTDQRSSPLGSMR